MSSSGSGSNNVVVENPIPDWARNEFEKYLNRSERYSRESNTALSLYDYTGPIPNENDTYAKRNNDEIDGITALAARARNGSLVVTSGKALVVKNLDGDNLNINTNTDELYDVASETLLQELDEEVLPDLEFEALSLNMFGSSGFAVKQAKVAEKGLKQLLDTGKNIFYGDYKFERDNQQSSLTHAITYGSESIRDAELLRQSGLYDREYEQGILTAAYREWHADQIHLIRKLEVFGNGIRAVVGAQYRKVVEPFYRPSPMTQIAGLAFAGAGIAASFYGVRNNQVALGGGQASDTQQGIMGNMPSLTPDALNRFTSNNMTEGIQNEW